MKTRRMLLTGLAALTTLAFSAGCGRGDAAEPPVVQGAEDKPPPPVTAMNLLDFTRELILTRTSDSAEPVALPGEEVVDVESAEPYYDEDFFR